MKLSDIFWALSWSICGAMGTAISADGFQIDKAVFMYGAGIFLGAIIGMRYIRIVMSKEVR